MLVARNSLKFVAHPFDPRKPMCDVSTSVIATASQLETYFNLSSFNVMDARALPSIKKCDLRSCARTLGATPTEHWHICIAFESFLVCIASGRTIQFARAFHRDDGHQAECITGHRTSAIELNRLPVQVISQWRHFCHPREG